MTKSNKKLLRDALLGMLLGAGVSYLGFSMVKTSALDHFLPNTPFEEYAFFASVLLGPFLAIALHEVGHLVAGLLQGYRLELFVVGFFGLRRENDAVKAYFNTDWQYFGGVAATSPKEYLSEADLRRKFKIILISGPLTSLLVGIVGIAIGVLFDTAFNFFWGILGVSSLGIFLATTLPSKSGLFFSDRKRYQRLSDSGAVGQIELAFLQLVNQAMLDGSYKNLSLEKIAVVKTDRDVFIQFWGNFFEYQYYKDNGFSEKADRAKSELMPFKEEVPTSLWKSLQIE